MLWDKMSSFSFIGRKAEAAKNPLPTTASTSTDSMIIDTKLNGGLDEHLRVFAMYTGAKLTAGTVTTELQTCDTVSGTYVKVAEHVATDNVLIDVQFPRDTKRFLKLVYKVGSTALNRKIDIMAGLVPDTEVNKELKLQNLNVPVSGTKGNAGIEDLNVNDPKVV